MGSWAILKNDILSTRLKSDKICPFIDTSTCLLCLYQWMESRPQRPRYRITMIWFVSSEEFFLVVELATVSEGLRSCSLNSLLHCCAVLLLCPAWKKVLKVLKVLSSNAIMQRSYSDAHEKWTKLNPDWFVCGENVIRPSTRPNCWRNGAFLD